MQTTKIISYEQNRDSLTLQAPDTPQAFCSWTWKFRALRFRTSPMFSPFCSEPRKTVPTEEYSSSPSAQGWHLALQINIYLAEMNANIANPGNYSMSGCAETKCSILEKDIPSISSILWPGEAYSVCAVQKPGSHFPQQSQINIWLNILKLLLTMLDTFSQQVSQIGKALDTGQLYISMREKSARSHGPRRQIKDFPLLIPCPPAEDGVPAGSGGCFVWHPLPPHALPGQENHRPPPWRRPRRCPINTHLFPVHLLRSRKRASLIISAGAASSALLARQVNVWPFFFLFFFPFLFLFLPLPWILPVTAGGQAGPCWWAPGGSREGLRRTGSQHGRCWPGQLWPQREGSSPGLPVHGFHGNGTGRWQKSHLCQPWSLLAAVGKHRHGETALAGPAHG